MKKLIITLLVVLLCFVGARSSFAGTDELVYSGYAADADGVALDGAHDVVVNLYAGASGGAAIWTETQNDVSFAGGFFSLPLCSNSNPCPDFGDDLFLGLAIDGDVEMSPRMEFYGSVRARVADVADSLSDNLLASPFSWSGEQTFDDVTVTNLTVTGSCTGCGGGGGGGGVDSFDTAQVATSGASEEILYTQTVAGGTLSSNGNVLRVKAWGTIDQSTLEALTVNLKINTTTIATASLSMGSSGTFDWIIEADIIRASSTSVKALGKSLLDGAFTDTTDVSSSTVGVLLSGDFDIVLTGDGANGAENVTAEAIVVELVP